MLIVGTDTETTGLQPGDHRFVELYAGIWDSTTQQKVDEFYTLVNPERSVPADATRIHGYTAADLVNAPTWASVASDFANMLNRGDVAAIHNVEFDRPFINYELKRISLPEFQTPCYDTFLQCRFATPYGKAPSLKELCRAAGVEYDTDAAHAADYDVSVMMQAFFRFVDWGYIDLNNAEALKDAA